MILTRFQGSNIHGFLNFDIKFNERLTFLTGVNGSGKTTILNTLEALLIPRMDYLAILKFECIELTIKEVGKKNTIKATKKGGVTTVTCSKFPKLNFTLNDKILTEFLLKSYKPNLQGNGIEHQFHKYIMERMRDNKIFQYIQKLPTPTDLGLDRRIFKSSLNYGSKVFNGHDFEEQDVLRIQPADGLTSALEYAKSSIVEGYQQKHTLDIELRSELMDSLFDTKMKDSAPIFTNERDVSISEIKKLKNIFTKVNSVFEKIDEETHNELKPFVNLVKQQNKVYDSINKYVNSKQKDSVETTNLYNELKHLTHGYVRRIQIISNKIDEYVKKLKIIFHNIDGFLETINSLFRENNKHISFDKNGLLYYKLTNIPNKSADSDSLSLETLSSGETQLTIIFAHLYFSPNLKGKSVLMIDEPELSLHVFWQEIFIEAILEASNSTQIILATHAPIMIMGRLDQCVEINHNRHENQNDKK